MDELLDNVASDAYCYLTTTGRATGRPHEIEIWFAARGKTLYLLAGGRERADWVRNLLRDPRVRVRVRATTYPATARVLEGGEEEAAARRMLATKYQGWRAGQPQSAWAREALPVALDLGEA